MPDLGPNTTPSGKPPDDRLNSWKEIAVYLKRDVTTVQRWEKRERMPVHRHLHDRGGSVYAFQTELDAWARSRNPLATEDARSADPSISLDPVLHPDGKLRESSNPTPLIRLVWLFATVGLLLAIAAFLGLRRTEYFWKNPIAGAQFQTVTEFEGEEPTAAVSHDGHFVAFLSDRDGQMDLWLTQVGSGQFHNLTHGSVPELVNPSIRTLGFSRDDALVTFWARSHDPNSSSEINTWAVPTLGGQPKPYLEGVAEYDWSHDGSRLAYHSPGAGDPLFVSNGRPVSGALSIGVPAEPPIFTATAGLHCHFPLWAPDSTYIYTVVGSLPDGLDIWRIKPIGGAAERITSRHAQVSYPIFVDPRTLMYLAKDSDGAGPWLYGMDVQRRVPHRLTYGPDRFTSLAASADGRRLVLTIASPKRSLWRLPITDSSKDVSAPVRVSLTTSTGFSPRLGPGYLLYLSASGTTESIWKLANGTGTELWSAPEVQILSAPAISPDGRSVAFSVRQRDQILLYVMQADGTNAKIVADSLNLTGALAWEPGGKSITSAVNVQGVPHLFRIPVDGGPPILFAQEYSVDPTWAPDGQFVVYSGPDIGTTFSVQALTATAAAHSLPALMMTRGARHLAFLPNQRSLVVLRGDLQHKNLWSINLDTGAQRQLTHLPNDFDVRAFDVSADGTEVVFEREQERSDVVLVDLPRP
jgi:Tol biopolymer transport system component